MHTPVSSTGLYVAAMRLPRSSSSETAVNRCIADESTQLNSAPKAVSCCVRLPRFSTVQGHVGSRAQPSDKHWASEFTRLGSDRRQLPSSCARIIPIAASAERSHKCSQFRLSAVMLYGEMGSGMRADTRHTCNCIHLYTNRAVLALVHNQVTNTGTANDERTLDTDRYFKGGCTQINKGKGMSVGEGGTACMQRW